MSLFEPLRCLVSVAGIDPLSLRPRECHAASKYSRTFCERVLHGGFDECARVDH